MPRFARTFEELRRIGAEAEVSRDALLWRQGDAGDEVVVLLEGLFDIVRESPEGDPVVMLEADDFDLYRDSQGERGADDAVTKMAQILHGASRKGDLIARLGGGRFAVLLYGASEDDAKRLSERLRERALATPFRGASA